MKNAPKKAKAIRDIENFRPDVASLFDSTASKSQKQKIAIIEAAIRSYATKGLAATSYTTLAEDCKISRPLIHHYFPTLESLFLLAAQYVRQTLLSLATEGIINGGSDAHKMIEGYVRGCFKWIRIFPEQCSFWMLYFYSASRKGEARNINTELVTNGHKRIQELIHLGIAQKHWKLRDIEDTAKAVQLMISGALVSCITEDGYLTLKKAEEITVISINRLLRNK